ncbi:hypothetical protein [Enhygromyxa salina]|nr:hypothetical protein [Enhygromyxa salina]
MTNTCLELCAPIGGERREVSRLDFFDAREGEAKALELVNAEATVRVVGLGPRSARRSRCRERHESGVLRSWAVAPETFNSEIGDVHERRGDRPSFTNEFVGASDSLIERERPPRPLEVGRGGRRFVAIMIVLAALLGGGGWALWYWSEPISEWFAGIRSEAEDEAVEDEPEVEEPEPAAPEVEPAAPEPEKVFGIAGTPEGTPSADPASTPNPDSTPPSDQPPVEPTPTPSSTSTKVEATATQVSGKVSSSAVSSRLAAVDEALTVCWAEAAKAGTKGPVALQLSLNIKWNGRTNGISVTGGSDALQTCVRKAVPTGGWPQPSDGGDAKVTRKWTLGG